MSTEAVDPTPLERHLEVQLAVSRILAGAHATEDVLTPLLEVLCEGFACDFGEFWALDHKAHRLYRSASWHVPEIVASRLDAASVGRLFEEGQGVPGRVWAEGGPVWIADVAADPNVLRGSAAARDGLHGCCAFPAISGDEVVAVFAFFCRRVRPPDRAQLLLMASIGTLTGAFLERVRVEAEAQAREKEFLAILEAAPDAIVLVDASGEITLANVVAARMFGYDRCELVGRRLELLLPERSRETALVRGGFAEPRFRLIGSGLDLFGRRKNGAEFPVEVSLSHHIGPQGPRAVAAIRDITERVRADALRAGQDRILGRIAAGLPLDETLAELIRIVEAQTPGMIGSVLLLDPDGVHVERGVAPSLPEHYIKALEGQSIGESAGSCGTAMYRRELVVVTDILTDPLWQECRVLAAPLGLRACWSTPILSSEGIVLGSFAMYYRETRSPTPAERELITLAGRLAGIAIEKLRATQELRRRAEQHESERRAADARLQQLQRIEAIGRLAGGVAHDFNNLLAVITGHCELLSRDLEVHNRGHGRLAQIRRAAERAAELTHQLLAFSRRQVLAPRTIGLNAVVAQVEEMLRRLIGEDVLLVTRLAEDLGRVRVDPGQIEQVLMNLAINARDAMPGGGRLLFETANVGLGPADVAAYPDARPGPYVLLTASDTGLGMSPETMAHIFEPFFTTKEQGKGTGLGLATVYGIIKQSGGIVTVSSALGRGSTFRIYLPRVEGPSEVLSEPVVSRGPRPNGGSETILLLEDDEPLRNLLTEILVQGGYDVLACGDAEEALALGRTHSGPIHLLLTDVVIPRMSGRQVAEQLASVRPKLSILYISGYTDDAIVHHGVLESGTHFMSKPFAPDAVLGRVRQVLDEARP